MNLFIVSMILNFNYGIQNEQADEATGGSAVLQRYFGCESLPWGITPGNRPPVESPPRGIVPLWRRQVGCTDSFGFREGTMTDERVQKIGWRSTTDSPSAQLCPDLDLCTRQVACQVPTRMCHLTQPKRLEGKGFAGRAARSGPPGLTSA